METIKDIWYALIMDGKIKSVHPTAQEALDQQSNHFEDSKVERVRVTIDRIKAS